MSKIINKDIFLKFFFEEPNTWFHVRELARLLKINPATVSKYLNKLSQEHVLIKKSERNHLLFKANTANEFYKDLKIYENVRLIKQSGLIAHLDKELHFPQTIILFGSYAKGENMRSSDIDLFIISSVKKDLDLESFEKTLSAKIQLFVKNRKEFVKMQKENQNLINSVLNGIIIKGYLEVFQ